MDADLKVRKQVSFAQLKALLEFLGEHQELARGLTRGRRGKLHTFKLWNQCAKKLNLVKDGAVKDGKAWSKYWCDWKYRVRRRALELKAAKTSNRPPPDGVTPLSGMEENILSIIGEGAVDNIVIKSDPLGDEDTVDEELDNNEETLLDQCYEADTVPVKKPRTRKRRHSTREFSELEDLGGTSSPRDKPGVAAAESDSAEPYLVEPVEPVEFDEPSEHVQIVEPPHRVSWLASRARRSAPVCGVEHMLQCQGPVCGVEHMIQCQNGPVCGVEHMIHKM